MPNPPLSPLASSIVDLIGNTPMVELGRSLRSRGLRGRVLVKLEYFSPGLSKKDRIAREMILQAKADGSLRDGQAVVELTSGNTGTGLAIVCAALGHPFMAVMSRGNSMERARMMQAMGAEVVLVDQAPGSTPNQVSGADLDLVDIKAKEIVASRGAFRADQFALKSNALAHERHTGPEIWEQSRGAVEVFVDFAGTGGSFAGTARHLKRQKPAVRAYILEPAGARALAGLPHTDPGHRIQGGGYSRSELAQVDRALVDDFLAVTDEDAAAAARILAAEEGIFGGYSTGANFAAAMALLAGREAGKTIVILACDSGLKYLSTDLYPWRE
ncbi:MAG: cysteine synthase family protein [Planctomycetota bacterium]|nr:cysteine synthase family protein [Planctomycetota bacterium]